MMNERQTNETGPEVEKEDMSDLDDELLSLVHGNALRKIPLEKNNKGSSTRQALSKTHETNRGSDIEEIVEIDQEDTIPVQTYEQEYGKGENDLNHHVQRPSPVRKQRKQSRKGPRETDGDFHAPLSNGLPTNKSSFPKSFSTPLLPEVDNHDGLSDDRMDEKRLAGMTEVQREYLLYEREEKLQALRERQELRRKLGQPGSQTENKDSETDEQGKRLSRNRKKVNDRSSSLQELKARRASSKSRLERIHATDAVDGLTPEETDEDEQHHWRRENVIKKDDQGGRVREKSLLHARHGSSSSSEYSDDEQSETLEEEEEYPLFRHGKGQRVEKERYPAPSRHEEPLSLENMNALQVHRTRLAEWVHMSFLKDAIVGLFVRLSLLEPSKETTHGTPVPDTVYRVALIEDVVIREGQVYPFETKRTDKFLLLRYYDVQKNGIETHAMQMSFVSNSSITPTEYSAFLHFWTLHRISIMSHTQALERKSEYEQMIRRPLTNDDVTRSLQEKKRLGVLVRRNPGSEKASLRILLDSAISENRLEEAERIQREIDLLEEHILEKNRHVDERLDELSRINQRNRQRNILELRQGEKQSKERMKEHPDNLDPFARRKCQPTRVSGYSMSGEEPVHASYGNSFAESTRLATTTIQPNTFPTPSMNVKPIPPSLHSHGGSLRPVPSTESLPLSSSSFVASMSHAQPNNPLQRTFHTNLPSRFGGSNIGSGAPFHDELDNVMKSLDVDIDFGALGAHIESMVSTTTSFRPGTYPSR